MSVYSKKEIERQFWRVLGIILLKLFENEDIFPATQAIIDLDWTSQIRLSPRYHLNDNDYHEIDVAYCVAMEIVYDLKQRAKPVNVVSIDAKKIIDLLTFEVEWQFFAILGI